MHTLIVMTALALGEQPVMEYGYTVQQTKTVSGRTHRITESYARCRFRSGTVIVSASQELIEQIGFALVGESRYTHAALVFAEGHHLKVLESDSKDGVRISDLQTYLDVMTDRYHEPMWILTGTPLTAAENARVARFARAHEGERYAPIPKLLRAATSGAIITRPGRIAARIAEPESWFCSEIVVRALQTIGRAQRLRPETTTPRDLMRDVLGPSWSAPLLWRRARHEQPRYQPPAVSRFFVLKKALCHQTNNHNTREITHKGRKKK